MAKSADSFSRKGRALAIAGKNEEAAVLLRKAVSEHPTDGFLFAQLGSVLWNLELKEESIDAWQVSASLDSDLECPRLILSLHLRELKRFEEAITVLKAGLDVCPASQALWHVEIGDVYAAMGDPKQAITHFDQALAFDSDDSRAQSGRNRAQRKLKRPPRQIVRRARL